MHLQHVAARTVACQRRAVVNTPLHTRTTRISAPVQRRIPHALPSALEGLGLDSLPLPVEVLAGLAGVAGLVAFSVAGAMRGGEAGEGAVSAEAAAAGGSPAPPPPPRENAVLVLGATGRIGRRVVQKLLQAGRTVVAAVRSQSKADQVFGPLGLVQGVQPDSAGVLFVQAGVDVTDTATLRDKGLWKGVTQVVSTLGGVFGPLPGGGFGILENMSPERVEAEGWTSLASLLPEVLPRQQRSTKCVLPMATAEDLTAWERLDDVIMGSSSASGLAPLAAADGASGARWKGELVVEGGGFCGARTRKLGLDLSGSDGLHLRVRGDGQTFKFNIKTEDQEDTPESTYQATFDTVPGVWSDVYLPWHNFVPVKRAQSDPEGAPLDASRISKLGLVLSRFEFNKMPNPSYRPGPFELQIEGGISAYRDPRPQIVLLSSAGVERNAKVGDDLEKRKRDIPIVQLNPGGTLNHKYTAENAVRASGYPYAVVRSTGMVDVSEGGPFLLEADQGDTLVGQVGRDEVADVLVAALAVPEAAGKTFELRRSEAADGKGRAMARADYLRLFLKLAADRQRWRVGLQPFPKAVPPPPPATEERTKEILQQVAVIRGQAPPPAAAAAKQPVTASSSA